jgi:hypothetical protein
MGGRYSNASESTTGQAEQEEGKNIVGGESKTNLDLLWRSRGTSYSKQYNAILRTRVICRAEVSQCDQVSSFHLPAVDQKRHIARLHCISRVIATVEGFGFAGGDPRRGGRKPGMGALQDIHGGQSGQK